MIPSRTLFHIPGPMTSRTLFQIPSLMTQYPVELYSGGESWWRGYYKTMITNVHRQATLYTIHPIASDLSENRLDEVNPEIEELEKHG